MPDSYITLQRLCFVLSFTYSLLHVSTARTGNKLVLRLVHRDSVLPLSYRPNPTISNLTFHHAMNSDDEDDIRAPLVSQEPGTLLLANVSIGEPPVSQLLAMDTGSPLTWIQHPNCTGCDPPLSPLYVPESSSSYTTLPCKSMDRCAYYYGHSVCGPKSQCMYIIQYLDQSRSTGTIALEKFTFLTSSGGIFELPDILLGCALENSGTINRLRGILGLQPHNHYSLVSRVGYKFSYCIGNISDPHYMYNQLILGEGAILEGYKTPMGMRNDRYTVTVEGISVGEKQIMTNYKFTAEVDSGSTITAIERSVFEPLKEEVVNLLDGLLKPVRVPNGWDRPCYWGNVDRDLKGFPIVTLHLAEGTDLSLDAEGMFQRFGDSAFCMAMKSSGEGRNIIGLHAQQYYNIGFNLEALQMSFQRIECELLED